MILGVVGSPRKGGNTEILVRRVLESARAQGAEVKLLHLGEMEIAPCRSCLRCERQGSCVIEDGMSLAYGDLLRARAIVLGTPVYYWNVSAQLKAFMDRTYCFAPGRRLRGKLGAAVVVARRAGCTAAFQAILGYFTIHRMRPAGGVIAYGDAPGDVERDAMGMGEAEALGRALARLLG